MFHLSQVLIGSIQLLFVSCGVVMLFLLLLIAAFSSVATERIIRVIDALRRLYYAPHKDQDQPHVRRRRGY
jgi:Na+-transporting methylmalonyl-CoA/oxaloacetate decarboxylase gamma subunit